MKTLKKTLCLVLAVVMAVGVLVLPANAATEFTDDADITHDEAVAVLSGLGIVNGVGDGSFNPDGTFTRAQAAALLANVVLTPDYAKELVGGTTKFSDVAATNGYNKYITWAVEDGYIHGYPDGSFKPNKELTGLELAALMLEVLGQELPTDGSYRNFVTQQTKKLGLNAGITGYVASNVISRDDAVQMMFNTMTTNTTGEKMWAVFKGSEVVEYFSSALEAYIAASAMNSSSGTSDYKADTTSAKGTILNDTYKVTANNDPDDFGNPQSGWKQTTTGKTLYSEAAEPTKSYTTAVKLSKIYDDLGLTSVKQATWYVNGDKQTTTLAVAANGGDIVTGGNSVRTGNGVRTNVFVDADGAVTITIATPVFAKVTKVEDVKDANTNKVTRTATFASVSSNGNSAGYTSTKFVDLAKNTYVVIYVGANDSVGDVVPAKTVTGTYTKKTTANSIDVYTIGDNTYELARSAKNETVEANKFKPDLGKEISVYVDEYGYILGSVTPSSGEAKLDNFIYVLAASAATQGAGNYLTGGNQNFVGKVYGILSTGAYGEYDVNYGTTNPNSSGLLQPSHAYAYKNNDAGEMIGTGPSNAFTEMTNSGVTTADFTGGAVSIAATSTYAVNSSTLFLYYTQATGTKTIENFSQRTGTANAGFIASGKGFVIADDNSLAHVVIVSSDYAAGTQYADVAYIDIDGTVPSSAVATASGTEYTFTYTAYTAAGEKIEITETKKNVDTATVSEDGLYTYNTDGTLGQKVTQSAITEPTEITVLGSTIKVGSNYYSYDAENVCFLGDDAVLTTGQKIVALTYNNSLTHIWVVEDVAAE